MCGEVKPETGGAAAKASLKRAGFLREAQSHGVDPKPGELPMARLKRG